MWVYSTMYNFIPTCICMNKIGAEKGAGLIIHHGHIIYILLYMYAPHTHTHMHTHTHTHVLVYMYIERDTRDSVHAAGSPCEHASLVRKVLLC